MNHVHAICVIKCLKEDVFSVTEVHFVRFPRMLGSIGPVVYVCGFFKKLPNQFKHKLRTKTSEICEKLQTRLLLEMEATIARFG